jgi:uncharacterized protein YbgA (DUF1722 family)
VLQGAGEYGNRLEAASKRELAKAIADYRRGLVPVVVPITLLRHHVRMVEVTYLAGQTYLQPHPKELMLRNQRLTGRTSRRLLRSMVRRSSLLFRLPW